MGMKYCIIVFIIIIVQIQRVKLDDDVSLNICCENSKICKNKIKVLQDFGIGNENGIQNIGISSTNYNLPCTNISTIQLSIDSRNLSNGLVENGALKYESNFYETENYCVKSISEGLVQFTICNQNCDSPNTICIPKCCEYGKHFSKLHNKCIKSDFVWMPKLYKSQNEQLSEEEYRKKQIKYFHMYPPNFCLNGHGALLEEDHSLIEWKILENGTVISKSFSNWVNFNPHHYCIDGQLEDDLNQTENIAVKDVLYYCEQFEENEEEFVTSRSLQFGIISICLLSSFFLLLTILIYCSLWDSQNIHGWSLICSFVSLFFMYIFISLMHLTHLSWMPEYDEINNRSKTFCWYIAIGLHFFYVSAFTWMTIVNFDLWFTFSNLLPTKRNSKNHKKFLLYLLFGIGFPTTILSITGTFDVLYRENSNAEYPLPNPEYGVSVCFIGRHDYALLIYLIGPLGVLMMFNITFFTITLFSVHKAQNTASLAVMSSSSRQKQSLKLLIKLFVIMGFFWIFELISAVVSPVSTPWYWAIFDFLNASYGIFIFIVFVCKRSTIRSLQQKYKCVHELVKYLSTKFSKCRKIPSVITGSKRTSVDSSVESNRWKRRSNTEESIVVVSTTF